MPVSGRQHGLHGRYGGMADTHRPLLARRAGHVTALTRPIGGEVENIDDPFVGPTSFEVECFGQGEATKISESAKASPLGLLKYLDTFDRHRRRRTGGNGSARCAAELTERNGKGDTAGGFIAGLEAEPSINSGTNRRVGEGKRKGSSWITASSSCGETDTCRSSR